MRYWECILDTPSEEIDERCDELAGLGVGGFVVEIRSWRTASKGSAA